MLIVIIIIGLLAGMIILLTTNARDKAVATKIVSNMRTIKSACILYYYDNNAWPNVGNGSGAKVDDKTGTVTKLGNDTSAAQVLGNYLTNKIGSEYALVSYDKRLLVKYDRADLLSPGVRRQIELLAPSANLWNSSSWSDNIVKGRYYNHYYYVDGNSGIGLTTFHLLVVDAN